MNPQVKEKWIKALRSGEYQQGKSKLRNQDNQYCCLGVLCDLYSKEFNIPWKYSDESEVYTITDFGHNSITDFGHNSIYLPYSVMLWADLSSFNPEINGNTLASMIDGNTLASMNDEGITFLEIADFIEEYL